MVKREERKRRNVQRKYKHKERKYKDAIGLNKNNRWLPINLAEFEVRKARNVEHKRELKESKREYSTILKECKNMRGKQIHEIPRFSTTPLIN
jgi:hypothetical protein